MRGGVYEGEPLIVSGGRKQVLTELTYMLTAALSVNMADSESAVAKHFKALDSGAPLTGEEKELWALIAPLGDERRETGKVSFASLNSTLLPALKRMAGKG